MKPTPKFLTIEQALLLHKMVIDEFGGTRGIRDEGLLRSSLSQPEVSFDGKFVLKDLHGMAASYLFHFVSNHAFVDGNKRIAALSAAVFLDINGYELDADQGDFEKLVMDAAQGFISKDQITKFLKLNSIKKSFSQS